jgi:hypothetical protein
MAQDRRPVAGSREHGKESSGSEKAGKFFIIWATMLHGIRSLIRPFRSKENANTRTDTLVSSPENVLGPFFPYIHIIVPCSARTICVLYNVTKGALEEPAYDHQSEYDGSKHDTCHG